MNFFEAENGSDVAAVCLRRWSALTPTRWGTPALRKRVEINAFHLLNLADGGAA